MADYSTQFSSEIQLPREQDVDGAIELLSRVEEAIAEQSFLDELASFNDLEWELGICGYGDGAVLTLSDD